MVCELGVWWTRQSDKQLPPLAPHHSRSSFPLLDYLLVVQQCYNGHYSNQPRLFCYLRRKMRTTNLLGCLLLSVYDGAGESNHTAIIDACLFIISAAMTAYSRVRVLLVVSDRYALLPPYDGTKAERYVHVGGGVGVFTTHCNLRLVIQMYTSAQGASPVLSILIRESTNGTQFNATLIHSWLKHTYIVYILPMYQV